jgi:SpoIID/LytB domain protein
LVFADPSAVSYYNGEFNKTIKQYKQAADKGDLAGYLNLAVLFKELGYYDKAIVVLRKAFYSFGEDFQICLLLGRIYYLDANVEEAMPVLKKALNLKPFDSETLINLGLCFVQAGQDTLAQECFQKVITQNQDNVMAHLSLADLYYRRKKLDESIKEFKSVSVIDASIQAVYKYWADILYQLGNLTEAYKMYQKSSYFEPGNTAFEEKLDSIRSQIGEEYFAKEKEKKLVAREKKAVFVKPAAVGKDMVFVRVGLVESKDPVEFRCSTAFEIKTKNRQIILYQGKENDTHKIWLSSEGKIIISNEAKDNIVVDEPSVIKPKDPKGAITLFDVKFGKDNFWSDKQDRSYRGELQIIPRNKELSIVNKVSLEEYLYSVVPSEMPSNWPVEALKAQAVAARSEVMAKLGRHKNDGFDFCAEVHCQVYSGVEHETAITNVAVEETRGTILSYKGKPVDGIYSSNCGGHTQGNIFSNQLDAPYFNGTFDFLNGSPMEFPLSPVGLDLWLKEPPEGILCDLLEYIKPSNFRWVRIYSADEMAVLLKAVADVGRLRKIIVTKRNISGHIEEIKFIGAKSSYVLRKELKIRQALGNLRSSMFKVEVKRDKDGNPKQFVFYGGGWGHGVGMCQAGACGMALKLKNYKEILQHYFKDVEFRKVY